MQPCTWHAGSCHVVALLLSLQPGLCHSARNFFLCDSQLRLLPPSLVALKFPSAPYHKFQWKVASTQKAAILILFLTTTGMLRGSVVRPRWPSCRITTCLAVPLDKKMQFSIVEVSRQAVRLVLFEFPRILFLNSCWGHAFWELHRSKTARFTTCRAAPPNKKCNFQ